MAVSAVGFKIIKRAVKLRVDQGEDIEDIIASYPKLSEEQAQELRDLYAPAA